MNRGLVGGLAARVATLSVRTVKFHVSALFVKFAVNGRGALMHKVAKLVVFKSEHPGQTPSVLPGSLCRGSYTSTKSGR
jgi:hypothetical protein